MKWQTISWPTDLFFFTLLLSIFTFFIFGWKNEFELNYSLRFQARVTFWFFSDFLRWFRDENEKNCQRVAIQLPRPLLLIAMKKTYNEIVIINYLSSHKASLFFVCRSPETLKRVPFKWDAKEREKEKNRNRNTFGKLIFYRDLTIWFK